MSYPRSYLRFAVATFYVFMGLRAFFKVSALEHAYVLENLAEFGIGCAATMWWVTDSMHRRREIPFASLWLGFSYWVLVLPVHYFSTRSAPRMRRFALHVAGVLAVIVAGAVAGLATLESVQVVEEDSQEDGQLGEFEE